MELLHLGHSCVVVDTGAARILLDPGTFSADWETVEGLDAVLVTHAHPDHLDTDRLPGLLARNPDAAVVVDAGTSATLRERGIEHTVRAPGESFAVRGSTVEVVGIGDHAVIHPDIPVIANNGYLVDGSVLHPGDAYVDPGRGVDVLLLPTAAPWLKLSEAVDYLRATAPTVAVPIHEALLARPDVYYGQFRSLAPEGTEVLVPPRAQAFTPD